MVMYINYLLLLTTVKVLLFYFISIVWLTGDGRSEMLVRQVMPGPFLRFAASINW
jgi:hypothetical protein